MRWPGPSISIRDTDYGYRVSYLAVRSPLPFGHLTTPKQLIYLGGSRRFRYLLG